MGGAKTTLLVVLGFVGVSFTIFWALAIAVQRRSAAGSPRVRPSPYEIVLGFLTDFFDTLGVGSFATTTSLYRATNGLEAPGLRRRLRLSIDDAQIPGTLNVGHALPTVTQAFIYVDAIQVEMRTLVAMIVAAVAGSLLGAPIVAGWPRRKIQVGLGLALLALCAVLVYRQFGDPRGGQALGLSGTQLWVGVAANFALGALMTIGVGLYAPCLVLVSLLGLNPATGFPIMMGSCAFLMPLASAPFVLRRSYSVSAALGLTLGGVPAVFVAGYIVKSLPLYWVKWLVAAVVVYTAVTLLAASRELRPRIVDARGA